MYSIIVYSTFRAGPLTKNGYWSSLDLSFFMFEEGRVRRYVEHNRSPFYFFPGDSRLSFMFVFLLWETGNIIVIVMRANGET